MVSQKQLDKGLVGGEGGQVNTWLASSSDGELMVMFEDIGCMYKSTNRGDSWIETGRNAGDGMTFGEIDPNNPNRVIGVSVKGSSKRQVVELGRNDYGLYLSKDGADSFTQVLNYTDPAMTVGRVAIAFDPSSNDPSIGGSSTVYFSTQSEAFEGDSLIISEHEISNGYNEGTGLYKTTDGGKIWTRINSEMSAAELAVDNEGTVYAAKNGTLYKSTDGGIGFTAIGNGLNVDKISLVGNKVYVIGDDGVSVSQNGGTTFTTKDNVGFKPSAGSVRPSSFRVNPLNENIMMYGYKEEEMYREKAYYSHDGGATWNVSGYNNEFTFFNNQARNHYIVFDAQDENIVYSTSDFPMKSINGGITFRAIPNGVLGSCVVGQWQPNVYNEDYWLIPSQDTAGAITFDGGETFTSLNSLGVKAHVYGGYVVDEDTYFVITSNVWSPAEIADKNNITDAEKESHKLLVTQNGGKTWEVKGYPSTGYRKWICTQSKTNSDILFAGNMRSTDGGNSWSYMSDPIGAVFSCSLAGKLFALGYGSVEQNSTVYTSDNNGGTWSELFSVPKDENRSYHGIQYFMKYDEENDVIYYNHYGYLNKYDCKTGSITSFEQNIKAAMDNIGGYSKSFAFDRNHTEILYLGIDGTDGKEYTEYNNKDSILRSCDGGNTWQVISAHDTARSVVKTGPAIGRESCNSLYVDESGYVYASFGDNGTYKFAPPYTVK